MFQGARITDVVNYHAQRGEMRGAVRIVRERPAERFRWRTAMAGVNKVAGSLRGMDRLRIEEPIRELVLDLSDVGLQREVVLDARKVGVDLDRGEVLPQHTLRELRRLTLVHGVKVADIGRYTKLPLDLSAPVDTAACAVVGRALAEHLVVLVQGMSVVGKTEPEASLVRSAMRIALAMLDEHPPEEKS